jgi:hypothetical protein
MFPKFSKAVPIVVLSTAAAVWAFGWGSPSAYAQSGCCQHDGGHAGHDAGSTGRQHAAAPDDHADHDSPADRTQPAPPHGGQLTTANPLTFEVVYLPQEIRVYLYGAILPHPESTKDVTGEVSLQLRDDERATPLTLRYATPPAGQQDYLSTPVDLSRVEDGELTATVKLANLPLQNRPGITFAQAVVVSKANPSVALASLDQSDQAGIARQRVCPVTGDELGSMGDPIKVLVGGQPLYLCCKGCLAKVQSTPEAYLLKAGQASQAQ